MSSPLKLNTALTRLSSCTSARFEMDQMNTCQSWRTAEEAHANIPEFMQEMYDDRLDSDLLS